MLGTITSLMAVVGKIPGVTNDLLKLQAEALQMNEKLNALKDENTELREKLSKAEEALKIRDDYHAGSEGVAWKRNAAAGEHPGPFCLRCLRSANLSVELVPTSLGHLDQWHCVVCSKNVPFDPAQLERSRGRQSPPR